MANPNPPQWSDLPQGWEALRYALAGVGGTKDPNLPPPTIVDTGKYSPSQFDSTIDLPAWVRPAINQPYIPNSNAKGGPELYSELSRWGMGVLPHELTHYLHKNALGPPVEDTTPEMDTDKFSKLTTAFLTRYEQDKKFANDRLIQLGSYHPMYAIPAENARDNAFEGLAERVAQPYTDAQEVGRRYQMFVSQGKQQAISTKRMSDTFFKNNV